jgi:predicted metal-binding protein
MAAEESESACVSVKEQNAMTRWGGDREVTHTQCMLACLRACAVARVAHDRGRGSEHDAAARWVACEDDHDLA